MKPVIFRHLPTGGGVATEHSNFNLFVNQVGNWCYSFDCNRFDHNPGTSSGWVQLVYDPEKKEMMKFERPAHYTNFDFYNFSAGGPERSLTVYLVAENDEDEALVLTCQTCIKKESWGFRVCLIPDSNFYLNPSPHPLFP